MGYTPNQRPWSLRNSNWQGQVDLFADLPNSAGSPYQFGVPNVQRGDLAWVTVGPTPGLYLCIDPTLGAAIWVPAGTGGGGGGVTVPDRRDHSVNDGACDDFTKTPCILRTNTTLNLAGGYNGGGVGNKGIVGHWLSAPLLLSAVASVEFTYERLSPEIVGPVSLPYLNMVVEFDPVGSPGVLSIFSFGDESNVLNQGSYSTPALGQRKITWTPGANFIQVVVDKGTFPGNAPPTPTAGPLTIPTSQGPLPPAATWNSRDYSIANLLIAYPLARIVNGPSGDGGLPRLTPTAGIMAILGDSTCRLQNAVRVIAWSLNGANI